MASTYIHLHNMYLEVKLLTEVLLGKIEVVGYINSGGLRDATPYYSVGYPRPMVDCGLVAFRSALFLSGTNRGKWKRWVQTAGTLAGREQAIDAHTGLACASSRGLLW